MMAKLPENTLILITEPLVGFHPDDVRVWLTSHPDNHSLAIALSAVHNQTGSLGHELDDSDDPWLLYAYESWKELDQDLYARVIETMNAANQRGESSYDLSPKGWYNLAKPFMEKNGFMSGNGWWVEMTEQ